MIIAPNLLGDIGWMLIVAFIIGPLSRHLLKKLKDKEPYGGLRDYGLVAKLSQRGREVVATEMFSNIQGYARENLEDDYLTFALLICEIFSIYSLENKGVKEAKRIFRYDYYKYRGIAEEYGADDSLRKFRTMVKSFLPHEDFRDVVNLTDLKLSVVIPKICKFLQSYNEKLSEGQTMFFLSDIITSVRKIFDNEWEAEYSSEYVDFA